MRHPLFHLSNLLQMPNDRRMVDIEFLSNFSCSCKISFDDGSQLSLSTSDSSLIQLLSFIKEGESNFENINVDKLREIGAEIP